MTRHRWERLPLVAFVGCAYGWSIHEAVDLVGVPVWRWVLASVLAAVVLALMVPSVVAHERHGPVPRWRSLALVCGASAVLVTLPSGSLAWSAVMAVALAAMMDAPWGWQVALAALPAAVVWVVESRTENGRANAMANLLACVLVLALVMWRRQRRESDELRAAQQRVIQIERTRAEYAAAQQALAEQLHDILAHTLSGLTVTLQGAGVMARQQGVSDDLQGRLDLATDLAKDGLREARTAVESLRGSATATSAAGPLGRWLQLTIDRLTRGAGMQVELTGDPTLVPTEREALARAVLTEGLTNSLRHAAGAPVGVHLDAAGVAVTSLGRGRDLGHESGGHGIAGLRERAEREGARLEAGPTADGFRLAVSWGGSR